jgi:hypothetical protein
MARHLLVVEFALHRMQLKFSTVAAIHSGCAVNEMSAKREHEGETTEKPGLYNSDGGDGRVFRKSLVQSLIALVPILLVALLQSPLLALYVFMLYMVIQNVESNVIMPIVFHRTAHIPPALGVVSQILFGSLLGFLGFVLAIPLMAVILQLVKMVYVEDILGDRRIRRDTP